VNNRKNCKIKLNVEDETQNDIDVKPLSEPEIENLKLKLNVNIEPSQVDMNYLEEIRENKRKKNKK